MSRQTILAYLSEEDRAEQVLAAAATVARRHQSHLIGAYVVPPITVYPMIGMEMPQAVYDGHKEIYLKRAKAVEETFNQTLQGETFVSEWRTIDSGAGTIADALIDHVRCSDFVIAPHYNTDVSDNLYEGVPEMLAMESGRPVLVLPKHAKTDEIGQHITIAWDGSREAARATFDSIPLLQDAKSVRILSLSEAPSRGPDRTLPAAEISATLSRHGIKCEADNMALGNLSIGDAILSRIGDMGSDLLIMGIYGHSKLRQFVFGGATRHILRHMTIPVMFSR